MKAKDFKVIINHIEDDFKLYINTENGLIEVKNFELNIKDGYLVLN